MALVRDFNLFPEVDRLLNLERKYGDSLTHYDLYGFHKKKKRRITNEDGVSVTIEESQM